MNPSLVLVEQEGSEATSSPQPGSEAGAWSALHLLYEFARHNKQLLLTPKKG